MITLEENYKWLWGFCIWTLQLVFTIWKVIL